MPLLLNRCIWKRSSWNFTVDLWTKNIAKKNIFVQSFNKNIMKQRNLDGNYFFSLNQIKRTRPYPVLLSHCSNKLFSELFVPFLVALITTKYSGISCKRLSLMSGLGGHLWEALLIAIWLMEEPIGVGGCSGAFHCISKNLKTQVQYFQDMLRFLRHLIW